MSDTLRCNTCQRDLPDDDFHRNRWKGRRKRRFRNDACRECASARASVRGERNRKLILEAKEVPCVDCGVRYPFWIMQFDHRDSSKKDFELRSPGCRALQKLKDEMAKCDVVCANCHEDRTHKRREEKRQRGEAVGCIIPRGTRRAPKTQTPSLPDALTLF